MPLRQAEVRGLDDAASRREQRQETPLTGREQRAQKMNADTAGTETADGTGQR